MKSFFYLVVATFIAATANAEDVLSILNADTSAPVATAQDIDNKLIQSLRKQIGNPTPEQNIFLGFLKEGNAEKALYQWVSAFRGSSFSNTPTGQALNGYLLFRNGLSVVGIETLFQVKNPSAISNEVVGLWREIAPASHNVWSVAQIGWSEAWSKVFDLSTEVRVRARNVHSLKNLDPIVELLKKTSVNTSERAWLEWQIALGLALNGDVGKAAKVLKHLLEAPNNKVTADHINLTAARLLFQNGYLDAALQYYEKVPKNSDFWIDAIEEMGWTYIRKGEPQNSLANTQTLMAKPFENMVGPEAVFLHTLGQLKICDYPGVIATLQSFKSRFRQKAENLVELSKTGVTDSSSQLIDRLKTGRVKQVDLGSMMVRLPRNANRDEVLFDLVQTQKSLEAEAKIAGDLYARSLSGSSAQVGFQGGIEELRKAVESRAQSAKAASYSRIKSMAEVELREFEQILKKMHIVEAEVIQQITQAERVIQASKDRPADAKVGSTGSKSKDKLVFPYDGETWFDELSNYKVSVKKGCQASKLQ